MSGPTWRWQEGGFSPGESVAFAGVVYDPCGHDTAWVRAEGVEGSDDRRHWTENGARLAMAAAATAGVSDAALGAGVVQRMVALLRAMEWDGECWPLCPYDGGHCVECNGHATTGHKADCETGQLTALLGDALAAGGA